MATAGRLRSVILVATTLFLCIASAETTLPTPEAARARIKTVAVMPVRTPIDLPDRAKVESRFEQALETRLAAAGITVIPASERRAFEDKVRVALGGYYDPRTGAVDDRRWEAFQEHVESEFRRQRPADAWLYSRIETRRAFAEGAWASWDGVRESSTGAESTSSRIFNSPNVTGVLEALSLHVSLLTPQDEVLYNRFGALQLLTYFEESKGLKDSMRYVPVRDDAILADPAREQRAVALVLDPLLLDQAQLEAANASNKDSWKQIKPVPRGERPPKPPAVDRAAFLGKYRRVALAAITLPPDLPNRAAVRERYSAALEAGLAKAGFVVVPPSEYAAVWDPIYAASGGFYDPMTGELLVDKRKAALREAFAKVGGDSPVDLVFIPDIVPRQAAIESGKAHWDGETVDLSKARLFDPSRAYGGTVPAVSLELTAHDAAVDEVFRGYGGIELLVRFKSGGLLDAAAFEDVPMTDWLANPDRDARAVERALGTLAVGP